MCRWCWRGCGARFSAVVGFGQRQYLDELANAAADRLYADALGACAPCKRPMRRRGPIAAYSHALLMREMELMPEWFLQRHLGLQISAPQRARCWTAVRDPGAKRLGAARE
jgi:aminoglycoside/choline kinase family phosphotransferase